MSRIIGLVSIARSYFMKTILVIVLFCLTSCAGGAGELPAVYTSVVPKFAEDFKCQPANKAEIISAFRSGHHNFKVVLQGCSRKVRYECSTWYKPPRCEVEYEYNSSADE